MTLTIQPVAAKVQRLRGKLKEYRGRLTGDEQTLIDGKRDQLVGTLMGCGYSREQASRETHTFFAGVPDPAAMTTSSWRRDSKATSPRRPDAPISH